MFHKFDKLLQTYIKEKTKLNNIKYCENDIKQEIKSDCIKNKHVAIRNLITVFKHQSGDEIIVIKVCFAQNKLARGRKKHAKMHKEPKTLS